MAEYVTELKFKQLPKSTLTNLNSSGIISKPCILIRIPQSWFVLFDNDDVIEGFNWSGDDAPSIILSFDESNEISSFSSSGDKAYCKTFKEYKKYTQIMGDAFANYFLSLWLANNK